MLRYSSSSRYNRHITRLFSTLLLTLVIAGSVELFPSKPVTATEPEPPPALTGSVDCAASINFGDTMTCNIGLATEADSFTFTANSGTVILVRVAMTAGTLRPLVRVSGPTGTELCKAGSPYWLAVDIEQCTLSESGTHTVTVTDYRATQTGTYNLYLQRLNQPVNATSLALGETATAPIQAAAEADTYTLSANANDVVLLRVGVTAGTIYPFIRVFDPAGKKLCNAGNGYSAGIEIAQCSLPQSGVYTVLVHDYQATKTGTYNLYAQRLNNSVKTTGLTIGTTLSTSIQAAAEADTYTLAANANDVVLLRVGVTAGTMYPSVRVFGLDGVVTCTAMNPYGRGIEMSRCLLPQTGNYTVLVGDYGVTNTGSYNLYLQRTTAPVDATAVTFGTIATATLPAAAEAGTFTVNVGTNDTLLVRVGVTAGTIEPAVTVYDPDGIKVCGEANPYGKGIEIDQCLVPRGGNYTIMVADYRGINTGSYNLYVQRLNDPTPTVALFPDDTRNATVQAAAEADAYNWIAGDNDTIQLRMAVTSGDMRPSIRVYDPDGVKVCAAASRYADSVEIASCILPRSGVYTILVTDYNATSTGAYRLSMTCLSTSCGSSQSELITSDGGQVQLGDLAITFPPNAVTQPISVTLGRLSSAAPGLTEGTISLGRFLFQARTSDGQNISQAQLPLTFTMSYRDSDLDSQHGSEASLRIVVWNAGTQQWIDLSSQVDMDSNTVAAQSDQISNLALITTVSQPDLKYVYLPLLER